MAAGFGVTISGLTAGAGTIRDLSGQARSNASALLGSLASLVDSAGDAGLAGSLRDLGSTAAKSSAVLVTVLAEVADTLTRGAATYQKTEEQNTRAIRGVR